MSSIYFIQRLLLLIIVCESAQTKQKLWFWSAKPYILQTKTIHIGRQDASFYHLMI